MLLPLSSNHARTPRCVPFETTCKPWCIHTNEETPNSFQLLIHLKQIHITGKLLLLNLRLLLSGPGEAAEAAAAAAGRVAGTGGEAWKQLD